MKTIPSSIHLRHKVGTTVTPGDRLAQQNQKQRIKLLCGTGTYLRQGHLYASLLGTVCLERAAADSDEGKEEQWVLSILPEQSSLSSSSSKRSIVHDSGSKPTAQPSVGDLILGRITRVARPSHAQVDIIALVPDTNDNSSDNANNQPYLTPLHEPFSGTLRQNDIRPNSSLEIDLADCIRPGDVVLARIHAMGGGGGGRGGSGDGFILTTAEAELGVIQAVCQVSGRLMVPVSWKEMECPVSGVREGRKVAKPRMQVR